MIGLAATLVTYSVFGELRNLPGLNLMALSLCLLAYQLIFETGVNERTAENRTACKVRATKYTYLSRFSRSMQMQVKWEKKFYFRSNCSCVEAAYPQTCVHAYNIFNAF